MKSQSELKAVISIIDVARDLCGMRVVGYKTNCPYVENHKNEDKNPSLLLSETNKTFKCMACDVRGDAFDLYKKIAGKGYAGALNDFGEYYGERFMPERVGRFNQFSNEQVKRYVDSLWSEENSRTVDYLYSRGLNEKTIKLFKLGWNGEGITIPHYLDKKCIGFRVRLYPDRGTKYISIVGSRNILYNYQSLQKDSVDTAIIVEGQFDVMALWQLGYRNVVTPANGASAFTAEFKSYFKNIKKVYVFYDNDDTGNNLTGKIVNLLGTDRCFRVLSPDCKDANDILIKYKDKSKARTDELLAGAKRITTTIPVKTLADRIVASEAPIFRVLSGFMRLDDTVQGFRSGNTYLIAGLEKSGKSALCMTMANNILYTGEKVAYFNTELSDMDFANRMTASWAKSSLSDIEKDSSKQRDWLQQYKNVFFYAGLDDLSTPDSPMISFDRQAAILKDFIADGVRVFVFDNLTTFATQATDRKAGWVVLASCLTQITNISKTHNVVSFVVIHTKPSTVFSETPHGVRQILQEDNPQRIFDESATVVRMPTLTDVYGGGGALSQLSGAMLVWRPFQKFERSHYQSMTRLILDSFRHSKSGVSIPMVFDGSRMLFEEEA